MAIGAGEITTEAPAQRLCCKLDTDRVSSVSGQPSVLQLPETCVEL